MDDLWLYINDVHVLVCVGDWTYIYIWNSVMKTVFCLNSLLGPSAASDDWKDTTFRGLAPSLSSGRTDITHHSSVLCTSAGLYQFCLRRGTEPVPETLYLLNHLRRLMAREDYIKSCRRESFKTYRILSFRSAYVACKPLYTMSSSLIDYPFLCSEP
jgi:hypothetical protein